MQDESKPPISPTPAKPAVSLSETDKKTAPKFSPDAVSRDESKFQQWTRSFLRWAGLTLIIFGLGALAAIFLFYVPKSNALKQANQDLATAEAKITELQSQITGLENQIAGLSTLEETNQTLQGELDQANTHIHLLIALADVRTAQAALAEGNLDTAKTQLEQTAISLTAMQKLLASEQASSVTAMLSRLELAQGELDNAFAAQSDLEVLAVNLLDLEKALFDMP